MHAGKRALRITGTGGKDKTAVMGISNAAKTASPAKFDHRDSNRKKKRFRLKSVNTWKLVPRCTAMRSSPTAAN